MSICRLQDRRWLHPYRVRVPHHLAPVQRIDQASEAAAANAGLSPQAIAEIWRAVERLYRSGAYPGVAFCLRRHGQIVLNRSLGHARGNGPLDPPQTAKTVLQPDTPICLFSASKAVTAILVHKLAEEGGIDLSQRVSHYLPGFAAHGKRDITIADVLSHRGRVPTLVVPREQRQVELLLDWPALIQRICDAPPTRSGGMAYHALTGGYVVAEILQRVTGDSLQAYLDSRLRKPLGLKHFTYGLPPAARAQVALNYIAGTPVRFPIAQLLERALMLPMDRVVEASNSAAFMDAVIPAGNLYATAEELSRFYQLLLDGGRLGHKPLLQPETVARAIRPRTRMALDRTLMVPMRYSEGLMLGANPAGLYGPITANAYGHLGFMNILGWADPDRDIAASLLVTGKAVLGTHLLALGKLLTTLGSRCR
jgi:CubicO group peptidase (beta-lactamase class C family)